MTDREPERVEYTGLNLGCIPWVVRSRTESGTDLRFKGHTLQRRHT